MARPAPAIAPSADWKRNRIVKLLTREVLRIERQQLEDHATKIVEIGRRLQKIKDELRHGGWELWLEHEVPYDENSARNYMGLARWATAHPREFLRFKHVGPTKLYGLALLDPRIRAKLRPNEPYPIPERVNAKTIALMTSREFQAFTRGLAPRPSDTKPGKIVQSFRHRIAGALASAQEMARHRKKIDPDLAAEAYEELLEVATVLEEAFDL